MGEGGGGRLAHTNVSFSGDVEETAGLDSVIWRGSSDLENKTRIIFLVRKRDGGGGGARGDFVQVIGSPCCGDARIIRRTCRVNVLHFCFLRVWRNIGLAYSCGCRSRSCVCPLSLVVLLNYYTGFFVLTAQDSSVIFICRAGALRCRGGFGGLL